MNAWLFLSKLTGIARRGVLKELEVCDFDKRWSACQETMVAAVKKLKNFLIIRQNDNMATSAILFCGLPPNSRKQNGYQMLICLYFGRYS